MPKWLLYALAAAVDFVLAFVFYNSGRTLFTVILAVAGLLFVIAAVGAARGAGGGKG
jgi:hypothetical protein